MSNLFELFAPHFSQAPQRLLLEDEAGFRLSYGEADARSAQLARYFLALGLQPGERLAVQVEKSADALLVYLAALRAGLVYLPLNTAFTAAELDYFLRDASPALVICDPLSAPVFAQLQVNGAPLPRLETLSADGQGSLLQAAAGQDASPFCTARAADDLAAICYTSGTTGRPKGAMLSHRNLQANACTLVRLWGVSSNDRLLHALPIFHVHGLFVACHCVLAAGASMIFLRAFDVPKALALLPHASLMMGVPTFYTRLLAEAEFTAAHCQSMRLFISGSAPLLANTHEDFAQRTGHTILERYGMTETGMLVSNPLSGERRAGTVGLPLPDVELRIVDAQGKSVAIDEVGSIQVRGPNVFRGYWNKPEKTAEDFTADGYFITGDLGARSVDGFISIVGRAKDLIITGGYNVYPKEVERVLDALPGVRESAVFGIADADFGERVVAAVVADGRLALDASELIAAARVQLAGYKTPKQVHILTELPRNALGKVQKNLLRQRFDPLSSAVQQQPSASKS